MEVIYGGKPRIMQQPVIVDNYKKAIAPDGVLTKAIEEAIRNIILNEMNSRFCPEFINHIGGSDSERTRLSFLEFFEDSNSSLSKMMHNSPKYMDCEVKVSFSEHNSYLVNQFQSQLPHSYYHVVKATIKLIAYSDGKVYTDQMTDELFNIYSVNNKGVVIIKGVTYSPKNILERNDTITLKEKEGIKELSLVLGGKSYTIASPKSKSNVYLKFGLDKVTKSLALLPLALDLKCREKDTNLATFVAEAEYSLTSNNNIKIEHANKEIADFFNKHISPNLSPDLQYMQLKDQPDFNENLKVIAMTALMQVSSELGEGDYERVLSNLSRNITGMSEFRENAEPIYAGAYLVNQRLLTGEPIIEKPVFTHGDVIKTVKKPRSAKLARSLFLPYVYNGYPLTSNTMYLKPVFTSLDKEIDLSPLGFQGKSCKALDYLEFLKDMSSIDTTFSSDNEISDDWQIQIKKDAKLPVELVEYIITHHAKDTAMIRGLGLSNYRLCLDSVYLLSADNRRQTMVANSSLFDINKLPDKLVAEDILVWYSTYLNAESKEIESALASADFSLNKSLVDYPNAIVNIIKRAYTKSLTNIYTSKRRSMFTMYSSKHFAPFWEVLKSTQVRGKTPCFYEAFKFEMKNSKSRLVESMSLKFLDIKNPNYYFSEISAVDVNVKKHSISESIRQFSPLSFGRICTYETPESKRVGVTTHMAASMKLEDGKMLAPLYKLVKEKGRLKLSKELEWLSVKDEEGKIVAGYDSVEEYLTQKLEVKKGYENTLVLARVPVNSSVKVDFKKVPLSAVDYVTAHDMVHLGYTAQMIPWIGSNQAVRSTFAAGQIKQAKPLLFPEVPRVYTHAYEQLPRLLESFVITAGASGHFTDASENSFKIVKEYNSTIEEKLIEQDKPKPIISSSTVIYFNRVVEEGQWVNKGDIIYTANVVKEGVLSTGVNALVAFYATGANFEDGIVYSRRLSQKQLSLGYHKQEVSYNPTKAASNPVLDIPYGMMSKSVPQTVGHYNAKVSNSDRTVTDKKPINVIGLDGYLLDFQYKYDNNRVYESDRADRVDMNYLINGLIVSTIDFEESKVGDKAVNRSGMKGTIPPKIDGDDSLTNSYMPLLPNGEFVDVVYNSTNVLGRGNYAQLMEASLGLAMHVLGLHYCGSSTRTMPVQDIKKWVKFAYDLANAGNETTFKSRLLNYGKKFKLTQSQIELIFSRYTEIVYWADTFDEEGATYLYDSNGVPTEEKVFIGYLYMYRLEHLSANKLKVRGNFSRYNDITARTQSPIPTKEGITGKGESIGHMELWAMLGYGAVNTIYEAFNTKGNNYIERNNRIAGIYCKDGSNENMPDMRLDNSASIRRSTELLHGLVSGWNIRLNFSGKYQDHINQNTELAHRRRYYKQSEFLRPLTYNTSEEEEEIYFD